MRVIGAVLLVCLVGCQEAPTVTTAAAVSLPTATTAKEDITARDVLDSLVAGGLELDADVGVIEISETVVGASTVHPTDLRIEVFETVEEATADRLAAIEASGGEGVAILQCQQIVVSVVAGIDAAATEVASELADVIRPTLESEYGPC